MTKRFETNNFRGLLGASVVWMLLPLITAILQHNLRCFFPRTWMEWIIFWITPVLMISTYLGLAGLIIVSTGYFIVKLRKFKFLVILPLVINVIGLFEVFMPIRFLIQDFEFQRNWEGYQQVVTLVEENKIRPNEFSLALLPSEYQYLSVCNGEILVDKSDGVVRVLFFCLSRYFGRFSRNRISFG